MKNKKINAMSPFWEGKFPVLYNENPFCVIQLAEWNLLHLTEAFSFSDYCHERLNCQLVCVHEKWTLFKKMPHGKSY